MLSKIAALSAEQLGAILAESGIQAGDSQIESLLRNVRNVRVNHPAANGFDSDTAWSEIETDVTEALRRIDLTKDFAFRKLGIESRPYIGEYRLRCPACSTHSIPYRSHSVDAACTAKGGCGARFRLAEMILPPGIDQSEKMARWSSVAMQLSELSGLAIMGYKPLNNGFKQSDEMLPLIIKLCRLAAGEHQYALHLAAEDFGLSASTLESARLGFYPSSETMMSKLNTLGVTGMLPTEFGWISDVSNDTHTMSNLACCFLKSLSGAVPTIWGYRPEGMRRKEERDVQYVVGRSWQPDSLYLLDILGSEPAVLVDGFMHALALRQAGFNAVAAPFISLLDYTIWRELADLGHTTIITGMTKENKSEVRLAEMHAAKLGIKLDWIEPTASGEQMIERVRAKLA